MLIRNLENLLVAGGLLASNSTTAEPLLPAVKPLTPYDLGAALAPLPGIRFIRSSNSPQALVRARSKDRFRPTENWSPIGVHDEPKHGRLSVIAALSRAQQKHGGHGYENITTTSAYGTQYGVEVAFKKQRLVLALDTGSADTWVVSARSNCTAYGGHCALGPPYTGGFVGGQPLRYVHLYIEYGDGEIVQGPLGPVDVTIAGVRVRNQTVALANTTLWVGNNVTSGVLGLAYPALTNAYEGEFGDHEPYFQKEYAPIFANMVNQGLVENFFSIAISRKGSDGAIAFGGVPRDLEGVDYGKTAMADIIIVSRHSYII